MNNDPIINMFILQFLSNNKEQLFKIVYNNDYTFNNDFIESYNNNKEYLNNVIITECYKRYPLGSVVNRYGINFIIDNLRIRLGYISFLSEFEVILQNELSIWSAKNGFCCTLID